MDTASKGSRLTPIRIGAALVVAGALSIGAAACGSGSSSDSSGSASTTIKKEAAASGATGMVFVVDNRSKEAVTLQLCGNGNCRGDHQLQADRSDAVIATDVTGTITYQDGTRADFTSQNPPSPEEPYIEVSYPGGGTFGKYQLGVGDRKSFGGGNNSAVSNGGKGNYYYTVKRSTDYIADPGDTQKSSPGGDVYMYLMIDGKL